VADRVKPAPPRAVVRPDRHPAVDHADPTMLSPTFSMVAALALTPLEDTPAWRQSRVAAATCRDSTEVAVVVRPLRAVAVIARASAAAAGAAVELDAAAAAGDVEQGRRSCMG